MTARCHVHLFGVLEQRASCALKQLSEHWMRHGDYARAAAHLRRWIELEPLCEEAHGALIRIYAITGRRDLALQQLRTVERALAGELGEKPHQALYELAENAAAPANRVVRGSAPDGLPAAGPPRDHVLAVPASPKRASAGSM